MRGKYKFLDLFLYSNLLIAIGALSMVWLTQWIMGQFEWLSPLALFVFFTTISVYAWHRIIGFYLVKDPIINRRSRMILGYRKLMIGFALISIPFIIYLVLQLKISTLLLFILPGILTILYTTPVFGKKRRLRDIPLIKVFIISFTWAWISTLIPWLDSGANLEPATILVFLEKFLFILGITIPFDIRDFQIDKTQGIQTLPQVMGISMAKILAILSICLCLFLVIILFLLDFYTIQIGFGLFISYIITIVLLMYVTEKSHDYYFSGLLDGLIPVQFLIVFVATSLSGFLT